MKTIILLTTLLLSSTTFADVEKRTLTDDEVRQCDELATMARIIQDIRVTDGVEVWDFYYKHGNLIQSYPPDKAWYLVKKVYHEMNKADHPAVVYRSLLTHCTKFTYESKPELEFKL